MVKFVDDELQKIRKEILEMWTMVYDQISIATEAVVANDKEKAWEVIMREKRVNASELKIDCDIEDFLVLYNPVAIDMRFIVAMLKINADLERIGDFAENIARFVIKNTADLNDTELLKKLRLEEMRNGVLDMIQTSKDALEKNDISLAKSLFEKDDIVDEININVAPVLAEHIKANPDKAEFCLNLKTVFNRIERTGDHVTNMAEEIIFFIDAIVLKHSEDKSAKAKALLGKLKEENPQ